MSTDPQLLRAESFREIGSILQRDATILVERWCQRAKTEQPRAARVHHRVLRDGLMRLLHALGRGLIEINVDDTCQHHLLAVEHGEQRWEAGWSLAEVVQDYQLLRLVLLDYLEQTLDRPLSSREVMAVGLALDEAITASVAMYVEFRDEATRAEERMRLEREQQSRAALEKSLRDRAAALAEADRRKDEFLATLAHELRNPLAPLANTLDMLRLPDVDPVTAAAGLDVADRQLRQLVRLVDDLLDVSRIAQGKIELRKQVVDVAQTVASAVQSARPLIESRRHAIHVEYASAPLQIEVDPARLEQVLTNLLNNAAKYTEPGGRIDVRVAREGNHAEIRVTDSGIGIAPELLPRIFELFVQSDDDSNRARGGLGIGLALVERLVRLHGGSVTASSAGLGRGSEFTVRLPIYEGSAPAAKLDAPRPAAGEVSSRVLLVDDNQDVVNMLAFLLRRSGHDVLSAHDGDQAVALALKHLPDVVLLDIGLPSRDGYEVVAELRKHPELAHTCLVAMTGYGQDDDVRRALGAGFHYHLLKPVRLDMVQEIVNRAALERR